jgi:hypothetical protein
MDDVARLNERVGLFEMRLSGIDAVQSDVALVGQALQLVHSILTDLVQQSAVDPSEFEGDLDRIEQIAQLVSHP